MSATLTRQAYTAPALTPRPLVNSVLHGDALEALRKLPDNSVDAVVSDPPAGINFMNMSFDSDKGGRDAWIAWLAEIMREALRVTKPGGHALIWALPRTSHWTATALEDAGWEIRDVIAHLQGQGFPKSHNISIAIDKHLNAEREVIGEYDTRALYDGLHRTSEKTNGGGTGYGSMVHHKEVSITAPATPESQQWAGFGTALKPSHENWILARKPLAEKTVAANVLRYGTGGLNIDATRISHSEPLKTTERTAPRYSGTTMNNGQRGGIQSTIASADPQGRFPSNTLFSHTLLCRQVGTKRVPGNGGESGDTLNRKQGATYKLGEMRIGTTYRDTDGLEEVDAWECDPACPVRLLDEQSGRRNSHGSTRGSTFGGVFGNGKAVTSPIREGDEGTAARYFAQFAPDLDDLVPFAYFSKPSRKERTCNGTVENTHPTLKSLNLMNYLISMITPPGGIVLDMFAGSGSTLVAAVQGGYRFIGIEQEAEYVAIAEARLRYARGEVE